MNDAEDYRRKAEDFLTLARQLTDPHDRAKMIELAAYWKERADETEQRDRVQQQHQTKPEQEPEGEHS